ncbi:hypothetical protein, partial [Pseudomonas sp. FSL R10-1339]|uniref:hypothetical protein n=1 Tax=Pseudomonas sp. FSL R10-1339 TaxID=2662196 RepID=UPI001C49954B
VLNGCRFLKAPMAQQSKNSGLLQTIPRGLCIESSAWNSGADINLGTCTVGSPCTGNTEHHYCRSNQSGFVY